jgi:hypothetical protein
VIGKTIGLYGESGSGKTTQAGEMVKHVYKQGGRKSVLNAADRGGYDSLLPLVRAGILTINELGKEDDPWQWIAKACDPSKYADDIGLVIYDSGTSMSEALLASCATLSAAGQDIGGRPAPKFVIGKGTSGAFNVGSNVDSHYGVVQSFMLSKIWDSTWMAKAGKDVLWTFGVHRGESADSTPILGPKLAGKALTTHIPKWFKYFFRLDSLPAEVGGSEKHLLYTQAMTELGGLGASFGNARAPLGATTTIPAVIDPASLIEFFSLLEKLHEEADSALRAELGL